MPLNCPLSSHQERLWFVDQFEAGNVYPTPPTYHNLPLLLRGRGRLDGARAATALRTLVSRHGALRTRIVTEGATAMQRIADATEAGVPFAEIDLGGARWDDVLERAIAEAQRPFYLQTDGLVRATLWRFGTSADAPQGAEFLLGVTLHHVICDRPSLRLIADEFAAILRDGGTGLVEPELHYADFADWQRNLPADALEPLLFYWKWQLRGRLAPLELPSARPRPVVHTFTAARHTSTWDASLATAVRALATQENSEPAAVALAAFAALLHRYARQDEIVIGTTMPGRRQPGTERLVGPVANLVVLRNQLGGNPDFRTLLADVTRTLRDARDHQEMPFDPLVLALKPEKDMSRTALFDVLCDYDDAPPAVLDCGNGVTAQLVETNLGCGKYDLNLALQAAADGSVTGALVYNADFHDAWFIAQLMTHFTRVVKAVTADPSRRIDDIRLLDADEERRELAEWNATQAAAPREQTLHALFAAQVRRTPGRIAMSLDGAQVSYAEVDGRANRLAHHLRAQGVGPDVLVAVCLERSIELVVTLLAVLKAGGAYLPLEPAYPRERLAFTVRDAQVRHLVTTTALAAVVSEPIAHVTRLDADAATLAAQPAAAPGESRGRSISPIASTPRARPVSRRVRSSNTARSCG